MVRLASDKLAVRGIFTNETFKASNSHNGTDGGHLPGSSVADGKIYRSHSMVQMSLCWGRTQDLLSRH